MLSFAKSHAYRTKARGKRRGRFQGVEPAGRDDLRAKGESTRGRRSPQHSRPWCPGPVNRERTPRRAWCWRVQRDVGEPGLIKRSGRPPFHHFPLCGSAGKRETAEVPCHNESFVAEQLYRTSFSKQVGIANAIGWLVGSFQLFIPPDPLAVPRRCCKLKRWSFTRARSRKTREPDFRCLAE